MLTEICNYLKNWFSDEQYIGYINVDDGSLFCDHSKINIADGQYFRVIGSLLSDAVYKYGTDALPDQGFNGAIWLMRVPADVIELDAEITAWVEKYGNEAASPYTSESFGGYSYSKGDTEAGWQGAFKAKLMRYRKL